MIFIDMSQVAWSAISSMKKLFDNDDEIDKLVKHVILNIIRSAKIQFQKEYGNLVICFDHKSWRKEIFPYYKHKRKVQRQKDKEKVEQVYNALREIRKDLKENFPYPVLHVEGAEGDDIIFVLSNSINERHLIYSNDKDLYQITNKNIRQYDPIKKQFVDFGIPPSEFLFEHIIKGDAGDGIPNIRNSETAFVNGIRQKPITKNIIKEAKNALADGRLEEYLKENGWYERWKQNEELIDMSKIPSDIIHFIIEEYAKEKERIRNESQWWIKVMNYFMKNNMKVHSENLQDFLSGINIEANKNEADKGNKLW